MDDIEFMQTTEPQKGAGLYVLANGVFKKKTFKHQQYPPQNDAGTVI
jgi:hypothetical protein